MLYVKINKQTVAIDKNVFVDLLELSPLRERASYINAITNNEISFQDLKSLAQKADIPYPLFFAPSDKVQKQLDEKNRRIYSKLPTKDEIRLSSRGRIEIDEIELIIKDLGRKQEFLKKRLLPESALNTFVGCVAKMEKAERPNVEIASEIRKLLQIDLTLLRSFSKQKVLRYICRKAEERGIFISFSSYNYMPQNIHKEVELSGICIKDKKFPFVFINSRDGDDNPKILEPDGRQIFTVLSMLVCIGLNRFVISTKTTKKDEGAHKKVYAIVGELLIPTKDLLGIKFDTINNIKESAQYFKVTPSMLLMRLRELNKIDKIKFESFLNKLRDEIKKRAPKQRNAPLQINAYSKYNGERFSKEVIGAYRSGKISQEEVKSLLFRRGKMHPGLFDEYAKRYS